MTQTAIPIHYLEPEEFFLLERIETADVDSFEGFHRHQFYEILWFTSVEKEEWHSIDFERYDIQKNDIYILSPHQVHTMNVGSKKGFLIPIAVDFFESLFTLDSNLLGFPYFFKETLSTENTQTLSQLITLIEIEYHGKRRRNLLEAYMRAFVILLKPNNERVNQKNNTNEEKVVRILQLINLHFKTEKEVDFYAKAIHLSKRRINEIMVKHTGCTVKQHIVNQIIIESKRYMAIQHLSLKEIAYELGFNDPAYFSRLFKNKTKYSPEQFRAKKMLPIIK